MTPLAKRRTKLSFMTSDTLWEQGKHRQVVIEAHPEYALVRLHGLRTSFPVSYGAIFQFAAKNAAKAALEARKAKKKAGGR